MPGATGRSGELNCLAGICQLPHPGSGTPHTDVASLNRGVFSHIAATTILFLLGILLTVKRRVLLLLATLSLLLYVAAAVAILRDVKERSEDDLAALTQITFQAGLRRLPSFASRRDPTGVWDRDADQPVVLGFYRPFAPPVVGPLLYGQAGPSFHATWMKKGWSLEPLGLELSRVYVRQYFLPYSFTKGRETICGCYDSLAIPVDYVWWSSWIPLIALARILSGLASKLRDLARKLHRARVSRQLRNVSLCRACGYDLRATPHRCPECGRVPDRGSEKAGYLDRPVKPVDLGN